MSKIRLIFSEAWSSISANISTTFAATMTVLIWMFLLGLFIALGTWVLSYSNHVKRELVVHVYFATGPQQPTQAQEYQVGQRLKQDKRVKSAIFVSKEAAFKSEEKKMPELYANVPGNPLPDSYVVKLKNPNDSPTLGRQIQAQVHNPNEKALWPGVNDVKWGDKTTKRVLTVAEVISIVFLVAIVLLVTASTLLIANTIRLSIFSRRREIEVMKLVGATNWFVRGPFMLEGLLRASSDRSSRSSSSCSGRRSRCRRSSGICTRRATCTPSRSSSTRSRSSAPGSCSGRPARASRCGVSFKSERPVAATGTRGSRKPHGPARHAPDAVTETFG